MLLHEPITPEDVRRVDADFAQHRVSSLLCEGGVAAMEEALMDELTFVGVCREGDDEGEELLPGGRHMRVTEQNKHFYCALLVEHFLVGFARAELSVLCEGFFELLPAALLRADDTVPCLTALDLELIDYVRARLERQLVACGVDTAEGAHAALPVLSRTAVAAGSAICVLAVVGFHLRKALRAEAQPRPRRTAIS